MPRYEFRIPIRAVGSYRLPDGGITIGDISIQNADVPGYHAFVNNVVAETAEAGFSIAQAHVKGLLSYLALAGEGAAFILDGREGLRARNLVLVDNPIPSTEDPPLYDSIGGFITDAGQPEIAQFLDPDGSLRRNGRNIVVHNATAVVIPSTERLHEIGELFLELPTASPRLRLALGMVHDAACARELASSFVHSYTALEVLTGDTKPPTLLNTKYADGAGISGQFQSKDAFLAAIQAVLAQAALSEGQQDRIMSRVRDTTSISLIDIFKSYFDGMGIVLDVAIIRSWTRLRGSVVHSAAPTANAVTEMKHFMQAVRDALVEELRRASGPVPRAQERAPDESHYRTRRAIHAGETPQLSPRD